MFDESYVSHYLKNGTTGRKVPLKLYPDIDFLKDGLTVSGVEAVHAALVGEKDGLYLLYVGEVLKGSILTLNGHVFKTALKFDDADKTGMQSPTEVGPLAVFLNQGEAQDLAINYAIQYDEMYPAEFSARVQEWERVTLEETAYEEVKDVRHGTLIDSYAGACPLPYLITDYDGDTAYPASLRKECVQPIDLGNRKLNPVYRDAKRIENDKPSTPRKSYSRKKLKAARKASRR